MKLLACMMCNDVQALDVNTRVCACGKSQGKYINDAKVEVSGPCRVLGIRNTNFLTAMMMPGSHDFGIFTIDDNSPSIKRK